MAIVNEQSGASLLVDPPTETMLEGREKVEQLGKERDRKVMEMWIRWMWNFQGFHDGIDVSSGMRD